MNPAVHLERVVRAPIDRVFQAFVDPAEAVQWWGPVDVETSQVEIDLRVGGRCRWVMHPGGATTVLHGRIEALDPPTLLVMTNRWEGDVRETLITLRFVSIADATRVELTHERLPTDPAAFEAGWVAALDSLAHHLERDQGENDDRID